MKNLEDFLNKTDRENCIDEIKIIRYVLNQCPEEECKEIKNHLLKCPWCFSEMSYLIREEKDVEEKDVKEEDICPEDLEKNIFIKKVNERIKKNLFLVFEFIDKGIKTLELIRHNGRILQPEILRDTSTSKLQQPTIVKDFNGYQVKVNVTRRKDNIDLRVELTTKKDENLVPNVYFILTDERNQKILEESIADGFVSFKGLKPDEYSIKIIKSEKVIGTILLDLRGSLHKADPF